MWGIDLEQFEDSSVKTIRGNRLECYYAFPERKANQYYPSLFYDRIKIDYPQGEVHGMQLNEGSDY